MAPFAKLYGRISGGKYMRLIAGLAILVICFCIVGFWARRYYASLPSVRARTGRSSRTINLW
jgi:hypothetical protein